MKPIAALLLFALYTVAAPPQRIVSTTPSITEILFALGLGDHVVGVTNYCNYPPEARKLPKIGTYIDPNLEAIAKLRPDLVVIQKNPIHLEAKLERLHLHVLEVQHDTVNQALQSMGSIAAAAGVSERGTQLTTSLRTQLGELRAQAARLPKKKVAFIISRTPGAMRGLVAVGPGSYLTDLFEVAGGINVFADSRAPYPKITLEELIVRDPDVIIDMGEMAETVGVTEAQKQAVVNLWKREMPKLRAVREQHVFAVANDIYVQPGPRMVLAARSFAQMLHPGAGF